MELYGSLLNISGSVSASAFTGSFIGDGSGIYNLPASGVTGLNLSQISTGSISASLSPDGFNINTDVSITGSLIVSGDTNITGALTASGLIYPTTDGLTGQFIQTGGDGSLLFQDVHVLYEHVRTGENLTKGDPVYVSGSQGANAIAYRADASDPNKMPVIGIASETIAINNDTRVITLGLIEGIDLTGFPSGTEVYVAAGGGWTSTRPTGDVIVQVLGYVSKGDGPGGKGVVLNPGPNSLPNISTNKLWIGDTNSHPTQKTVGEIGVAITGSNLFVGTQTVSGSIIPSVDNQYDLGSTEYQWRDVYISSGSLYIDGTKVISSTTQELTITTDNGQSIKILEAGSDSVVIQTADGDIELKSSGGGDVLLDPTNGLISIKGTTQIQDGYKITSSGGNEIVFGDGIIVSGSIQLTGTIDGIDLAQFKSDMDSMTGSNDGRLDAIEISTGSLNSFTSSINTTIKNKLNAEDVITGSIQVDITGTSGYTDFSASIALTDLNQEGRLDTIESRYATTGSNSFLGDQTITGSLTVTNNFTVLGSSSLLFVTTSQLAVSASVISVNIFEPAERFGGLKVYDSGSESHLATASLLWDSLHNHWIYQNASGSLYSGGMFLSGPRNTGSLGDEVGISFGKIPKSVGGDHLDNSIMNEDGSTIHITGSLSATGTVYGTNISALETESGSIRTDFNSYTSSNNTTNTTQDGRLDSLESATGSYTTTDYFVTSATFGTGDGVITLTRNDGNTVTVDIDGRYLQSHPSVSAPSSSDNSGRTYIQDILLDSFGHITGLTTATETVVNTDTNYYVTGATFGTGDGVITLTRNDGNTVTVDIDGRYLTSYTETDTLDSVTSRGATTTSALTITSNNRTEFRSSTSAVGVGLAFSDLVPGYAQKGYFDYFHSDTLSYGSGNAFVVSGTEASLSFVVKGKILYSEGIYTTPATGTGAGTRKDLNWDTAYGWGNHANVGYLTSLPSHNHDGVYMKTNRTLDTINTIDNGGDRYNPSVNNPTNEHYAVLTYGNGGNVTGQLATHFQNGQLYSRGYNSSWSSWKKYVVEDGGTWGINISGNAATSTSATSATSTTQLSGYSLEGATSVATRIFNNKGQDHNTYTNFNTVMTPGPNYIQGPTNGPTGTAGGQWYGFMFGLGGEYGTSTGTAGHYASQLYYTRISQDSNQYLWARDMEGGTWGSWRKLYAGYADTAGTAGNITSYTINQNLGTGNSPSFSGLIVNGDLLVNGNWSSNSPTSYSEAFTIQGTYPSMAFRSTTSTKMWLNHMQSDGALTWYHDPAGYSTENWAQKLQLMTDGTLYSQSGGSLGTATYRWANVYTNDLHLSNEGKEGGNDVDGTTGDWTIQEGEENLYIINHKNGKKYKIDLTEI